METAQKMQDEQTPPQPQDSFKTDHLFTYILPPLTGFITLHVEKSNEHARFSAYQSVLLGVLFLGTYIMLALLLPGIIEYYVLTVLKMVFFGMWLYCVWNAYTGKHFVLPYIGKLAQKLTAQNA
jgi:uncharacterized membrane protein